ncbi:hypothetical protein NBRC116602_05530 [Hyphomicrobiales bacterium 4NK60-0047b]|jgi:predicted transcriptional regulator
MKSDFENSILQITAKIVEAFVKNNEIPQEELPAFIQNLYADLFRELEALSTVKKKPKVTKKMLETLLDKIEDDKKYYILSDLDLKKILFYH